MRPPPGAISPELLRSIVAEFDLDGLLSIEPFAGGHINDSYLLTCGRGSARQRFLLQRINPRVFPEPRLVMENLERVIAHIASARSREPEADRSRRVLKLVRARDGTTWRLDESSAAWRVFEFIEGAITLHHVTTPADAFRAGRAFAEFQALLADYRGPRLHDTIPDFHHTPLRVGALERAIEADRRSRTIDARREIELALARRPLAPALLEPHRRGAIPERIVHNDAKLSNLLLDPHTGEALSVVDLDLVMPGLALYDFGDMARSMTCLAAEDEVDLSRAQVQPDLFEGLAQGYLEGAAGFLTPSERSLLVTSALVITYEQAIRFLTDFLEGDTYYKTTRPGQNLDRCRVQFSLLESFGQLEERLTRMVEGI